MDEIISRSEKTIKTEIKSLDENPTKSLSKYFTNDLLNDCKYYDDYFNEIFNIKTINFKTGLQDDRILSLMVNF